jgi:hypothetical protein
MQSSRVRSLWTVLPAFAVLGFAAAVAGCASAGPVRPVAVSEIKSVAGTWKGLAYSRDPVQETIELTIHEDGSYDVVSSGRTPSESRSKGRIELRDGRLILQGERGRGLGTVLSSPGGERVMNIEATMSDNRILSVRLWPSR